MNETNPEVEILMTPQEVSEYLSISLITLSRYMNQKKNPLPCYRISGRTVRIKLSELLKWIEKRGGTYDHYVRSRSRIEQLPKLTNKDEKASKK